MEIAAYLIELEECNLEADCEFTARKQINVVRQTLSFKNTFEEKKRKRAENNLMTDSKYCQEKKKLNDKHFNTRINQSISFFNKKFTSFNMSAIETSPITKCKELRRVSSRKILSIIQTSNPMIPLPK